MTEYGLRDFMTVAPDGDGKARAGSPLADGKSVV